METLPYVYLFAPACTLILVLIWRDAKRAGYAPDRVAAAMAACAAGAVIGSKVLMFDFHAAQYGEKTFLGAVVGGVITLAIVLKVLEFDTRAFDVPVLPVIWGHALGRVGCFVSSCCHGIETTAPWGVQYASMPAPVHPTQLYESVLDVALALVLTRHRARFHRPASVALTGAIGIAMVRFTVEPWRASAVPGALGLTVVQMTTLAVIVVTLTALVVRERLDVIAAPFRASRGWERSALVLTGVVIVALTARAWLTPLETLLVGSVVVAATGVILYRAVPRVAMASPAIGLAVVAPMQARDSLPPVFETVSWHSIGTSVAIGSFDVTTEDCDGNVLSRQPHTFKTIGVSAETYTQERPGVGLGARFTGFTGLDNADRVTRTSSSPTPQPGDTARRDRYSGATLAATVDRKWVGATLGLATGRWAYRMDYPISGPTLPSQTIPVGGLRLGKLTGFHGSVDINTHTPAPAPGPLVRVGLNFADTTGNKVIAFGFEDGGLFLSGKVLSRAGVEIEPYAAFGGQYQFGVGFKKRFYRKR